MDSTKEHKIISICSGSLGIERGLRRAGANVRTVAYVEIEAFVNFNLVAAMEAGLVDKAPIWTDLQTFDGKPFHKRIHGIVGGYPCQGESFAGQRKLTEDPRFLYPHIERIIKSTKPIWCFFENVQGHLSGSFSHVLKSLQSMGYKVEAGLYTACEVGAPHQRKRIFILACSNIAELRRCVANPSNQHGSLAKVTKWSNKDSATNGKRLQRRDVKGGSGKKNEAFERGEFSGDVRPAKVISNPAGIRSFESSKDIKTDKFNTNGNTWPAGPGQAQYEWEEPRTIESGMGCTVNGYNFRTDLLRMFGNGVVEQTAALAFPDLLSKFK